MSSETNRSSVDVRTHTTSYLTVVRQRDATESCSSSSDHRPNFLMSTLVPQRKSGANQVDHTRGGCGVIKQRTWSVLFALYGQLTRRMYLNRIHIEIRVLYCHDHCDFIDICSHILMINYLKNPKECAHTFRETLPSLRWRSRICPFMDKRNAGILSP